MFVSYGFFFFFFSFFFEGVEYQVLTNSDSTTKLIDIAALLGKSMGMWHACVCSFMFHRVLENGFFLGGHIFMLLVLNLVFFFLFDLFIVGLALVDCSASSETIGVMKQVVDLGCCVVMANKKPLTSTIVRNLE